MKPYLYLWLSKQYHVHGLTLKNSCDSVLRARLREFKEFNPEFGRRRLVKSNLPFRPLKYTSEYNLVHAPFSMETLKNYFYCHSHVFFFSLNHADTESTSTSESTEEGEGFEGEGFESEEMTLTEGVSL